MTMLQRISSKDRTQTIRELFDRPLADAEVSCYTIFAEDLWQPGLLIPQDIDTALFYPEATYAAPDSTFHAETMARLEDCPDFVRLRAGFFSSALDGPASGTPKPITEAYKQYGPLFQSFLQRERIKSSAAFSLRHPLMPGNTLPELLFFNFRKDRSFDVAERTSLSKLANDILQTMPALSESRNRNAYGPAKKTIRAFSGLIQRLDKQLRNPAVPTDNAFYTEVAGELHRVLCLSTERTATHPHSFSEAQPAKPHLIVSIYLVLMHSTPNDAPAPWSNSFRNTAEPSKFTPFPELILHGSSSVGQQKGTQALFDPKGASITVCTTVTGCPHLLQHVDPYVEPDGKQRHIQEYSIDLTRQQIAVALTEPGLFKLVDEDFLAKQRQESRGHINAASLDHWRYFIDEGSSGSADTAPARASRLILWTPYCTHATAVGENRIKQLLAELTTSHLGRSWPWLAEKMSARTEHQYATIFGELDQRWELPSSEVCVPIRFAGQSIGCVNIESKFPDRFNFTYVGLLSSFATIIGMLAARNLDLSMMKTTQRVLQAIHSKEFEPDGKLIATQTTSERRYTSHILDDRYCLNELATSVARATWADRCYFISTGGHVDDPMRILGTSDTAWHEGNNWLLPRFENGINNWLAQQPESTIGLILDLDLPRHSQYVRRIVSNADKPELHPENPSDVPVFHKFSNLRATRLIFCRLPLFGSHLRDASLSRTNIILAYGRSLPPADPSLNSRLQARLDSFITYIFSLCLRCSSIADHWNSALLARLTVQENIAHGPVFKSIEHALHYYDVKPRHDGSMISSPVPRLRDTWINQKVSSFLSAGTGHLNAEMPEITEKSLESLITLIVTSSRLIAPSSGIVAIAPIADDVGAIRLSSDAAIMSYYLLTQCICNSIEHGSGTTDEEVDSGKILCTDISVTRTLSGLEVVVSDNGVGFPPSSLPDRKEYKMRLPVLIAGRSGRGFDLMLRAGRFLNKDAPRGGSLKWHNVEPHGASISFLISNSHFREV